MAACRIERAIVRASHFAALSTHDSFTRGGAWHNHVALFVSFANAIEALGAVRKIPATLGSATQFAVCKADHGSTGLPGQVVSVTLFISFAYSIATTTASGHIECACF
jgi:hypothetical protein